MLTVNPRGFPEERGERREERREAERREDRREGRGEILVACDANLTIML